MNDKNSLAQSQPLGYSSWRCKYHIEFAPKYRRKVFYKENRKEIGAILRELCRWKQVNILEATACPDHIHLYVEIPPKLSVAGFVGFLKGKSRLILHERDGDWKYRYGSWHFWCRGYYVDTVDKKEKAIAEYVRNQLKEDQITDQMTLREFKDPFTGTE